MTSALPSSDPDLLAVIDRYRTCEFATLSKSGVPIAWPTVPLRRPDGSLLITTSIALPQKAYNVRRDGRVALLFSEPTASGLTGAPELLLQGTATCPDEVATDIRAHAGYWHRLHERQPANAMYSNNPISRRLFDWYYMRLLITVTPSGWSARSPLPPGPATSTDAAPDGTAGEALSRLATFPSAVLGTRDPDGAPRLRRIRVTGPAGGALALSVREDDDDLVPGPASLLAHSHDDRLWSQRSSVVLGALARTGAGWTFQPERIIGGLGDGGPLALVRMIRELRRTAQGYLERRSLPRPQIPWADLQEVKAGLRGAGTECRQEPAGGPPSSP
jgi:hypothetical protein